MKHTVAVTNSALINMFSFKKLVCIFLFALLVSNIKSQTHSSEFGEITRSELNIKEIDFDKEADAVIIYDVALGSYNDDHNLVLERRIRIKVLKEKGVRYADVEIPFYSKDNFETIMNLQANVHTPDNNGNMVVKKLERQDIFKQKINDRVSIVKFALPNVKVGSIIEYKYESLSKTYGGLDDWYFQSEIPTLLSSFELVVLPSAEFAYQVHRNEALPIKIKTEKKDGTVLFEMRNIAGLRNEPYMDAEKDYLQHVVFQLSGYITGTGNKISYINTWDDVSKQLMGESYFGKQVDKSLENSDAIISKFKSIATEREKIIAVYDYVRRKFLWNGMKTKFTDNGVKEVWEKGKGTSAEINLLLINLLKSAGVEVYPLLVSERSHGKVSTDYPILDQFNKVVAYVVSGDKIYVLDGTDDFSPIDLIPLSILNTKAFIVRVKKGSLIDLKDDAKTDIHVINIASSVDERGLITGDASITSSNYGRITRSKDLKRDKEKFKEEYFVKNNPEIKIDSFEVINAEIDSLPLEQHFKFTMPAGITGDYKLINLNLFTGLEKNPFISDNRFSLVNFGARKTVNLVAQFMLPPTLKPEELPKNIQIVMPDKSITLGRMVSYSDNNLFVQISFKINRTIFTADEYPSVKDFYKKMYAVLDEQIVLTGK